MGVGVGGRKEEEEELREAIELSRALYESEREGGGGPVPPPRTRGGRGGGGGEGWVMFGDEVDNDEGVVTRMVEEERARAEEERLRRESLERSLMEKDVLVADLQVCNHEWMLTNLLFPTSDTLHLAPLYTLLHTLHPAPYTPYTIHHTPHATRHTPYILNHKPSTAVAEGAHRPKRGTRPAQIRGQGRRQRGS